MVKMRKAKSAAAISAEEDPMVEGLTLCLDLRRSGQANGVVGRMDPGTRRYSFTRVGPFYPGHTGLTAAAEGLVSGAVEYFNDVHEDPE